MKATQPHYQTETVNLLERLKGIPWPEPKMVIMGNAAFHKQVHASISPEDIKQA